MLANKNNIRYKADDETINQTKIRKNCVNKNDENYRRYIEQSIKVYEMEKEAKQKTWEEFGAKRKETAKENRIYFMCF